MHGFTSRDLCCLSLQKLPHGWVTTDDCCHALLASVNAVMVDLDDLWMTKAAEAAFPTV